MHFVCIYIVNRAFLQTCSWLCVFQEVLLEQACTAFIGMQLSGKTLMYVIDKFSFVWPV